MSGLYARPAALLAEAASNLGLEATIAPKGDEVVLRASGAGAVAAPDWLVALLETDLDAV